ncbi:MAG: thioredoxin-like domain-containing protein [Candidatus Sulfotelmatobacter sp.]|jgi:thiol-disulfide isomerase/thioredoxin
MLLGKLRFRLIVAAAAACVFPGTVLSQDSALDLDGHAVNPLSAENNKPVVLVFLRRDCPVSARYAPIIQQISKQYASAATFYLVYPDQADTAQQIRTYLSEYGYSLPALRDPARALVKLSRVQITPEVAVFGRNHQLLYEGRIDNWYVDLSRARPAPTTHELEEAIRAASAGKTVARSEVRGVGCYISDLN